MNCPVCDAKLRQVNKHGVEVDICPDCKGVWLDRGELEKIIQMVADNGSSGVVDQRMPEERPREQMNKRDREYEEERYGEDHHKRDDHGYDPRTGKRRRRESWFSEIFDAFGGGGDD